MWYLGPAIDLYFNASTHYEVTKWLTLGMLVCIPVLSFRYGKLLIHYFALCGLGVVLGASLLNCALFVEPDPIHGSLVSRREALNGDPAAEKDMPLLLAWQKDGAKLVHDLSLKSDDQREDNDHAYNVYIPVTYTDGSIDVDRGIKTMPIYNFRDAFEGSQRFLEAVNTTIRINKADIAAARIISTQGLFSQYGTFVSEGLHVLVMYWEIVAFLSLIGWVARCLTRRLVWPRRKYA
jgi:hypothetical protein